MRDLRAVLVIVSLVHGVLRKGHGLVLHFERPIVHPYCDRSFRQTPLPVEFPVLKAQEPMLVQIPRVAKRIRSRNSAEYIVPLCHARTWTGLWQPSSRFSCAQWRCTLSSLINLGWMAIISSQEVARAKLERDDHHPPQVDARLQCAAPWGA